MSENIISIEKRKLEHIEICLNKNVASGYNYWEDINLVHNAIPGINKEDISTNINIFGKKLNYPIFIGAMSGGPAIGEKINENCAKVASDLGIGFCVGSQRPFLENPKLAKSYSVIKNYDIPLVSSNIGASQLIQQKDKKPLNLENIKKAMEIIGAHMLTIHLNYPQEMIQPEGNENSYGLIEAIKNLSDSFTVIVKECGSGISKETAQMLKSAGVKGIEVSGISGTNWVGVEYYRAKERRDKEKERAGKIFWDWGIPAPVSVLECKEYLPTIASGGIKNGLDVAKGIALGAKAASIAGILLPSALKSSADLKNELTYIINELKIAMFLTGAKNIEELKKARYVITGKTSEYMRSLKIEDKR